MTIETKIFCPLGAECESIKDGVIQKCMWHVKIGHEDPQTGEKEDKWSCAMSWLPVLMIENGRQQRSTAVAVESFRNEMVKANESSQQVLLAAANAKLIEG